MEEIKPLKVLWADEASTEYDFILDFWYGYTYSYEFPEKLDNKVSEITTLIARFPEIFSVVGGEFITNRDTNLQVRRAVILKNFSLYYQVHKDHISIISFRDNRRNTATN
ncbi:hypothetical protein SAMN05444369_11936 [Capnocytophaga haemolytica]|uniref:Addiction module toxin RelE n=1 Tax=Capnocytophaga haemolytica TaxID=45243 RepID=A0AAX2H0P3_9FLAO|nr:hypothetical protein [Capnocytophaga haemolytica]AMD84338.1 hypothetical protein AXF12_01590 [Capnocytophaga haemolytica]SFO30674.1 hypothetical protein SAMN05444369_11936 [Capnocytophaga haemolytica]SNV11634.1 Uncharacterised protein [Capnocytophaga haemolytica]